MPWENNSNDGGRPGGPWGQIPGGGGGGGGGPRRPGTGGPNIEDLFSRGRDQFRGGLPGGRMLAVIIIALIGVFWVVNSVYQIEANQVGVVTFLGQPQEQVSEQGLHFMLWPLARVQTVRMTQNQIDIGDGGSARTNRTDGLMLTGDQNIVNVSFSVFWQVSSPQSYIFNVRDPDEMTRLVAESAMREVVGRRPAQDVFRDNREGIQTEVAQITQDILTSYNAGISINSIQLANVAPPTEVADAFDEVQRAEQDQTRFQEEARQYANTRLGNARGQSAQVTEGAAAYKNQVVQEAEGEAARFTSVYEEYAKAPDVTRRRLYFERMEQVLGDANKMIIEKGAGSGVVPYVPLSELSPRGVPGSATTNEGGAQ